MVFNKFDNKDQTTMQNQSIYLRFLSLLHAIEGKGELPNLDLDAKRLLEVIAVQHSQGKPLTVSDAMAMTHIAMFEGPEKQFQKHIADVLVREHTFAVPTQDEITDTEF